MKADRPLWIDSKGVLCDRPPSTGYKIAGIAGQGITAHIVRKFNLTETDGKVTQGGEAAESPESTPPPMIADRELHADDNGTLYDEPQGTGYKIADAGRKIPVEYIRRYNLEIEEGKVVQKKKPNLKKKDEPDNKAAEKAPNKGARGSGGLTVSSKKTGTKTSGGSS